MDRDDGDGHGGLKEGNEMIVSLTRYEVNVVGRVPVLVDTGSVTQEKQRRNKNSGTQLESDSFCFVTIDAQLEKESTEAETRRETHSTPPFR